MIVCPNCNKKNIDGVDHCERCGQSLSELHLQNPATPVERALLADRVATLNPKQPITVAATTPVKDVIQMIVYRSIGCLIVSDGETPLGIFSERDALVKINDQAAELGDRPVSEFMTENPESLQSTAKIAFAVQRMDLGGFRHIPIVAEDKHLSGIISVRDILRYLTERMTAEA